VDNRIKAVVFNEKEHTYFYNGVSLHGVTGAIGKMMGKSFPEIDTVKLATMYGSDVHKEVENYFNKHDGQFNDSELSTEGAKWLIEELKRFSAICSLDPVKKIECEVMVSDFEGTASKVDVVAWHESGKVTLFDIKTTTKFDRAYCSLQLSVYKRLFQENYDADVHNLFVLNTKIKRSFHIFEQESYKVRKVLQINKGE
jgi:hypothetical protein